MRFAALICVCPLLLATVVCAAGEPKTSWKLKLLFPQELDRERAGYVVEKTAHLVCECRTVCSLGADGKCIHCKTVPVNVTYTARTLRPVPASPSKLEAADDLKVAQKALAEATHALGEARAALETERAKLKAAIEKKPYVLEEIIAAAKKETEAFDREKAAAEKERDAAKRETLAAQNEKWAAENDLGIHLKKIPVATHRIEERILP